MEKQTDATKPESSLLEKREEKTTEEEGRGRNAGFRPNGEKERGVKGKRKEAG